MSEPLLVQPARASGDSNKKKRNTLAQTFADMADEPPPPEPVPTFPVADTSIMQMFEEKLTIFDKKPLPVGFKTEWLGTSMADVDERIELQRGQNPELYLFLRFRDHYERLIDESPYDPEWWTNLGCAYNKLGFSDVTASCSFKGLLLVGCNGEIPERCIFPSNIQGLALHHLDRRYQARFASEDSLPNLRLQGFLELLVALTGCTAYWDGLKMAKEAIKIYGNNPESKSIQSDILEKFRALTQKWKDMGAEGEGLVALSRSGKICQRPYPWLASNLYFRSPSLLENVNKHIGSPNAIAMSLFQPKKTSAGVTEDVGPLGLFATQDIKETELILVDESTTGVSDASPSSGEHCEACHAALFAPFGNPQLITKATCCTLAVYCSPKCYKAATKGYHRVICGKDFSWLWDDKRSKLDCDGPWRVRTFLRVIATVLADNLATHPLQHPLIARMAANYPRRDEVSPESNNAWDLLANVVGPTRILMQLGINVISNKYWSQEVIQTIIFRIENNASQSRTTLQYRNAKLIGINPNYLFLNHSCHPNVQWNGSVQDESEGVRFIVGFDGKVRPPGASTIFCRAKRDIKKGEELKISYVGDPLGTYEDVGGEGRSTKRAMLQKWFPKGCGCETCEKEKLEDKSSEKKVMDMMMGIHMKMQIGDGEQAKPEEVETSNRVAELEMESLN